MLYELQMCGLVAAMMPAEIQTGEENGSCIEAVLLPKYIDDSPYSLKETKNVLESIYIYKMYIINQTG